MRAKTLLSKSDAKKFSELGDNYPSCDLTDIYQVELEQFRGCLGIEFRAVLMIALKDYSAVLQWTAGSYVVGNVVKNKGAYWIVKANTATEPITENDFWGLAPKFDTDNPCGEKYDELYCNFLGRFLALKVATLTAARNAADITAQGMVRKVGEGFVPADSKSQSTFFESLKIQAQQVYENMVWWMNENNETGCFDLSPIIKKENLCETGDCEKYPSKIRYFIC